ncbi:MAG: OmpA family protein, partial [Flavobacteriales bacterium]
IIEIGSHTDCIGSEKSNLRLSNKRAKAVIDYVVSKGILKDRIFGKGYGETRPLEPCDCEENDCLEDQHALNRRTEFRIVAGNRNY